ncbi:MAG: hypothetical protein WBM40_08715 [Thiohalocapsa sp.]
MDSYLEQTMAVREDVYRCPVSAASVPGASASSASDKYQSAAADSEAVVAAMSRCLGDFSRDVAAVVGALPKPLPPAATVSPL